MSKWTADDFKEKNNPNAWTADDFINYKTPEPEPSLFNTALNKIKELGSEALPLVDKASHFIGDNVNDALNSFEQNHPTLSTGLKAKLNDWNTGLEKFNNTEAAKKLQAAGYGMGSVTGNNLINKALIPDTFEEDKKNAAEHKYSTMAGAAIPFLASGMTAGANGLKKLPGVAAFNAGEKLAGYVMPHIGLVSKDLIGKIAQAGFSTAMGLGASGGLEEGLSGAIDYAQGKDNDPIDILKKAGLGAAEGFKYGLALGGAGKAVGEGIGKGVETASNAYKNSVSNGLKSIDEAYNLYKDNGILGFKQTQPATSYRPSQVGNIIQDVQLGTKVRNTVNTPDVLALPPAKPLGLPEPIIALKPTDVRVNENINSGTYKIKNTAFEKAKTEYDNAVEALRNHYGTSDIQGYYSDILNKYAAPENRTVNVTPDMAVEFVKRDTGIDIKGILDNLEKAETKPSLPDNEYARMKRVSGLGSDKSYALTDKLQQLSNMPNENIPITRGVQNDFYRVSDHYKKETPFTVFKASEQKPIESNLNASNIGSNINSPLPKNNGLNLNVEANKQIPTTKVNSDVPAMHPEEFNSIKSIEDLPDDAAALKSYLKEAERRILNKSRDNMIVLPIDLQLFAEAQKKLSRFDKNMQRFSDIEKLVENSDNWKDKGAFSFSRETWDRNPIDVAGIHEGTKIKRAIIDPIHQNEAVSTRMKNDYRGKIAELKLTPKESELVQRLGENKLTLDDLKQVPNVDYAKVEKAVETFRGIYNELFTKANEVLTRNGYDPVPYRKNYFPHFDGNDGILKQLGIDIKADNLPTDIAGLTAEFKPGKNWFGNFLQRKSDLTTFDAIQGFDRYLEGISRVINHTDDIQRLRTFIQAIRNKHAGTDDLSNMVANLEEYTNNLAGKKSIGDRGFENTFGRKMYSVIDAAKRRVGSNMVALNPASWLTNTVPLINAAAENSTTSVIKALNDTAKNVIKNDGFTNNSTFLTNRIGSDPLYLTSVQKVSNTLTTPFKAIDQFVSQVVTRAKYYDAVSKGVPETEAIKIADDWAAKTIGDRSLGSMPTLFNQKNPLVSLFTQFQLEVNNQMSHLFKDLPQEFGKAKLASVGAQVLLYSYLYNEIFKTITGSKPAFDMVGYMKDIYSTATNKSMSASKKASQITQDTAKQLPFASSLVGGGRLPISAAIPDPTKFTSANNVGKELVKPIAYLVPPIGGGQLKKSIEGLEAVNNGGEYSSNGNLLYRIPKTPYNYLKAGLFGKNSLKESKDYYDKGKK